MVNDTEGKDAARVVKRSSIEEYFCPGIQTGDRVESCVFKCTIHSWCKIAKGHIHARSRPVSR